MNRYICIHGHFYQPPRENPWLEEVELQDSAYPYHDWNERITSECYAPNTASRILDPDKRIIDIVNNYARISFDIGPTLLSWIKMHNPDVYRAIIEADRLSQKRFSGHGSAIAQAYNHIIMPLANSRDRRTQIIWGIRDFEHRFERKPEGMWLPETAANLETLDILAEHGITFTILAPRQARRVRRIGDKKWKNVTGGKIDPRMPYLCRLPSGRTINLFFYDGQIAQDVAFSGLLDSGENFAERLMGAFSDLKEPQLVHIATDGESYGHHHRYGDMALACALHHIESGKLADLTNYAEYLEKHPPTKEVEIIENSSWSCAHGVERWRSDCGCNTLTNPGWNQGWRAFLRKAMDWLRDNLIPIYEREMASCIQDPWQAREDYIKVILNRSVQNEVILDGSVQSVESFLLRHALRKLLEEENVKVLKLLEMQRCAMLMYTSCGWFFDDISGIETVQAMRYASRAMQLAREVSGEDLEPDYLSILERAPSNIPDLKDGARVWELFVKPAALDLLKVAAHYAISSLFEEYPETTEIFCYTANSEVYDLSEMGIQKLAVGRARIHADITGEERSVCFAVLHLGDHNLIGGVREYMEDDFFSRMRQEITDTFMKSYIAEAIRLMDRHFEAHSYSLWHLFRDEQRKVLSQIIDPTLSEIEASFRQIYEYHYPVMQVMRGLQIPLPKALANTVEFILNTDLRKSLENEELDLEHLQKLVGEAKKWSFELDRTTLGFVASQKINSLMEKLFETPEDVSLLETIETIFRILSALSLELDLWKAQNIYFSISRQLNGGMREGAEKGDRTAQKWVEHFSSLQDYLYVGCV
jgi:alpha-amylase/alpha-mannosidase (GH57 family)